MLHRGDKVWIVPNSGGEPHPAIVIRLSADGQSALVISGTGTGPRDEPHEVVEPGRRATAALKITKKTYFYEGALHVRRVENLEVRETPALKCPLTLWEKLQALALAGARRKLSTKDFAEYWPEEQAAAEATAKPISHPVPTLAAPVPEAPASPVAGAPPKSCS
jgi:hypothetical protein